MDFLLVEAMQILEDETCPECGSPIWVCRNEFASNIGFKVRTSICYARAELERWQEQEEKKKSSKKDYGVSPYTVPYTYDGSAMPSRMQFYKDFSEKDKVE